MSEKMDRETAFTNIKKAFERLPNKSTIEVYNHEESFGFIIPFTVTGFGFGEITLGVDKETGEAYCDLEEMPTDLCGQIVERTFGETVEDAEQNWKDFEERNAE